MSQLALPRSGLSLSVQPLPTSAKKSWPESWNLTTRLSMRVFLATSHFPAMAYSSQQRHSKHLEHASSTCTNTEGYNTDSPTTVVTLLTTKLLVKYNQQNKTWVEFYGTDEFFVRRLNQRNVISPPPPPFQDKHASCWREKSLKLAWVCPGRVRLESGRSRVRIPLAPGFFRGRVIPVTSKLALQWLPCQAPGVIGSALGLVGPVSVYCDWVRWKVWSAASISVWQHVKLSVQIRPWDTLACCWDDKQPTNKTNCPGPDEDAGTKLAGVGVVLLATVSGNWVRLSAKCQGFAVAGYCQPLNATRKAKNAW